MNKTKRILSCDWGTSSFRLRLVDVDDKTVVDEVTSSKGNAAVYEEWLKSGKDENERINFYKEILQSFITQLKYDVKDVPVIIAGMASSTIGMKELDYKSLPFEISPNNLNTFLLKADENFKHDILLISGIKTGNDVMRGEETMLLGFNFRNDENAIVIFPGTHSKHVVVKNNVVTGFKTYMTGEFFKLLSTKSLLSKSVIKNDMADDKSFIEGVNDGSANNILNASFHVRTNQLFNKNSAKENYHYLSGLLIGNELSELLSSNIKNVVLVSGNNLMQQYTTAINALNKNQFNITTINADEALIKAHIFLSQQKNLL